ncbi:lysophospholipid acyltransferase family protein [Leyella stercorea]|uniref:lysophospholipid acyltransferase family protein n=1 Tax=Leyella stercorea TaxID=363265 RepID=UPI003A942562
MYYFIYFIIKTLSYIPFWMLYAISDIMYYPLYYVIRYRREIVRKNLTESFPEKSPSEIITIEKKFYRFFMDMLLESSKIASISPNEMRKRMKFVNIDKTNKLLDEGKSLAFFMGHFCNWEWMTSVGLWIKDDVVCAQVYHKLINETFDKIIKQMRERMGNICVEMRQTARFVASMKAENKACMVALIADQSPKRRQIKHYVKFLNHMVPVLVGPEKIANHFGYMPIFVNARRVKRGYYECEFSLLHNDPTSLPDYKLTDLYFERLEDEIRKHPECYLWTHNRFKYAKN